MVNIVVAQPSGYGCTREVTKHEKKRYVDCKKSFTSANTKTKTNYRITTKYNLLESKAYDFKGL